MEQRPFFAPADAGGPVTLPPGRLHFEQVAQAAIADGLVASHDLERVRFSAQGARNASEVHPLVLLANLKLATPAGGELSLERLTEWLARRVDVRYLRVDPTRVDVAAVTALVSHAYARRHRFLPLAVDSERVLVATSEPLAQEWRRDLQHLTRRTIELAMVNPLDLHRYTMEFYGVTRSVRGARGDVRGEVATTLPSFEQLVELGRAGDVNADDQHIVHIVDWLLQYAYEQRASDIHLEPRRDMGRMRFRIDGVLHKVFEVPPTVMTAVVSRIKVLGRMDLAERRRPQDGRIKTRSPGGREVEMRLSTMPTAFGEKCVMRIFDPDAAFKSIDQLGFSPQEAAGWNALVERPHGIVLVTGPTGSGKTTTLYSTLKRLATPDVNVCTVEDPIEMIAPEFNQMQVQANIDLDFASGVRTLLRQDPDIIMIGEIRDLETAQMAVQASLTGHLVLSTLHTNDAASAVTRLLDLGVPHYLLASTLNGILAQRLVRTLCPHCKQPHTLGAADWAALADSEGAYPDAATPYRPVGCLECRRTGFLGRIGLYELLPLGSRLRGRIRADMDLAGFSHAARSEGLRTLRQAGLEKVALGLTTIEEVLSVLPPPDETSPVPDPETGRPVAALRRYGRFPHWIRVAAGLEAHDTVVIDVEHGDALPDIAGYAGVLVTGSAAYVTDRADWSERSAAWLREVVHAGVPVFGICYGHQLLAHALGGEVAYNPAGRESGTIELALDPAAAEDPLFGGLPARFPAHATHMQTVLRAPEGAAVLARSTLDGCHAFRWGRQAWGVQFHPEFATHHMRGYVRARADCIGRHGGCARSVERAVTAAPLARQLLRRFVRQARLSSGAAHAKQG